MKLSRILLALVVIALLASNGFLVYQNNRNKSRIEKLQTNVTSLQKSVKSVNANVDNADSDIQSVGDHVTTICLQVNAAC